MSDHQICSAVSATPGLILVWLTLYRKSKWKFKHRQYRSIKHQLHMRGYNTASGEPWLTYEALHQLPWPLHLNSVNMNNLLQILLLKHTS